MTKVKLICAGLACAVILTAGIGLGTAQQPVERDVAVAPGVQKVLLSAPDGDTDEAFIRRVSIDLRGIEPSLAEIHFFVTSKDAKRRDMLVELFIKERNAKRPKGAGDKEDKLRLRKEQLKKQLAEAREIVDHKKMQLEELAAWAKLKQDTSAEMTRRIERLRLELSLAELRLRELTKDLERPEPKQSDPRPKERGGSEEAGPPTALELKLLQLKLDQAQLNRKEKQLLLEDALAARKKLAGEPSRGMLERIEALRQDELRATIEVENAEINLALARQRLKASPPDGKPTPQKN